MKETKLLLVPVPKKMEYGEGTCRISRKIYITIPAQDKENLFPVARRIKKFLMECLGTEVSVGVEGHPGDGFALRFEKAGGMGREAYALQVGTDEIKIQYGHAAGAFYGVSTLKQLILQCGKNLPCVQVADEPDFAARGIMVDIGRDKIPTMDTLYWMVDRMADLKLNQLQLYMQGFPFAYPSFPQVWESGTPVTGEEIMELDAYCKERFVELVPNQNCFGHMDAWLAREEFRDLAECPEGFVYEGTQMPALSLNPLDPRSFELVDKLFSDLLPYFSSDMCNVSCDETLELGMGKSGEVCAQRGTGQVYLDFLLKIYEMVRKNGRQMMFWGDIIIKYTELVPRLPKDVIALVWGYDANQPNAVECEKFMESGVPFYVCPGTSSWNSIAGRTENMKQNLLTAAENGKRYGAIGFLNTDWGDMGHWQYLPVSYAGFMFGAALSWGVEQNRELDLAGCLDRFVFKDENQVMGRFVLDLGRYSLKEKKENHNITGLVRTLYEPFDSKASVEGFRKEDFSEVSRHLDDLSELLQQVDLRCADAGLIYQEYSNAIRLLRHAVDLSLLKLSDQDQAAYQPLVKKMLADIIVITEKHKALWLKRNRLGGLEDSVRQFGRLRAKYEELIK